MLDKVTVKKDDLLQKLIANRDKHQGTYDTSMKKYYEAAIKALQARKEKFEGGDDGIDMSFDLPKPRSFVDEYDRAIEMLSWHEGDTVVLDQTQFRQYVLDEWNWSNQFLASSARYM